MKRFITLILLSFLLSTYIINAQSPKKYFKTAKDFIENGRYNDAIELLTKAINLDPDYEEAYLLRASANESIGNMKNAAEDYKRASVFLNKDAEVFLKAGRAFYNLGNYNEALTMLNKSLDLKKNNLPSIQMKVLTLVALEDYYNALQASETALKLKLSANNYYYHGLVFERLKNPKGAQEDYEKAIKRNKNYIPAYVALARLQLSDGDIVNASKNVNEVLIRQNNNVEAYLVRSDISKIKLDFPNAINDLSKAILIETDNPELYFKRGMLYQDFTQNQNAINDFTQAIMKDENYAEAYYQRATSYENIADYKSAIKDYQKMAELVENDKEARELLDAAKKRLYELNRESEMPVLSLLEPKPDDNKVIDVPKNRAEITLKGKITDESNISFVKINNQEVPVIEGEGGFSFVYNLIIANENLISLTIGDSYNNILQESFQINRTEVTPPKVSIIAPYASDNGEVYLSDNSSNIYVEGKIEDESIISSIIIEGVAASYRPEEANPTFSATIGIANKNKFTVRATDKYGNESVEVFRLNRESADILADNPMGKTWVVFIENSDYQNFASLDGPAKDVSLMKASLANYVVHNFIHKKDVNKQEMERFFSIELRDLIRSNRVNSLLVWYAGHGKFINETGYWIPTDANRDDEFTYFNINALKASLQGYTNYLTHTLVITDACESGPTFYQAMRDSPTELPTCNDYQATRFKSSQVFSSAGYELAADNSQFTRTFANTLVNNPNACMPIEEVVQKVTEAVISNNQQKPRFGKITGLEDENGTFFFMTKE